jgi:hypothetical protein
MKQMQAIIFEVLSVRKQAENTAHQAENTAEQPQISAS